MPGWPTLLAGPLLAASALIPVSAAQATAGFSSMPVAETVAATSARNAWAVGATNGLEPLIRRWNGTSWQPVASPAAKDGQLFGVTALSARSAWAVGSTASGTLILGWNGTAWTRVPSPRARYFPILEAVAAASARSAWAVGYRMTKAHDQRALILRWNGTAWRQAGSPGIPGSDLTGVAAVWGRNAWAVGTALGRALILHWDGTAWRRQRSPKPGRRPQPVRRGRDVGQQRVGGRLHDGLVPYGHHPHGETASWSLVR